MRYLHGLVALCRRVLPPPMRERMALQSPMHMCMQRSVQLRVKPHMQHRKYVFSYAKSASAADEIIAAPFGSTDCSYFTISRVR